MRRAVLAVSLIATAFFFASVANAESSSSAAACPLVSNDIRACEANLMQYEMYEDANTCQRARCVSPTGTCPTESELQAKSRICAAAGNEPERFNDGRCMVIRCNQAAVCPTEHQNNDVIAKCKSAGKDYEYVEKGSCEIVQCSTVRTCPSNYDLDRAVAACTKQGETYQYTNDGSCRQVQCTRGDCQEMPGYRTASWECYDGYRQNSGDQGTCRDSESWQHFALDECKGRCSPTTGKCGVNSFNVDQACGGITACGNPSQTCPSMEENARLTDACTAKGGTPAVSWDHNNCKHVSCDNVDALPTNYQPEQAGCKVLRSSLVKMKNAGHDDSIDFSQQSGKFAVDCQTGIRALPIASVDEPVLEDGACSDYDNPYPDVEQCSTEGKAAAELYRRDIATGMPDGQFAGNESLNRAQTAKFLLRACNLSEDKQSSRLAPDIDATQWYAPLIRAAMAQGVILGNPDGTVRPADTVNHAEFTAMLTRACGIQPVGWPVCSQDVKADDWFATGAAVAEAYNLYPNAHGFFSPAAKQTRTETAVAIYQYLKNRDTDPSAEAGESCFILGETPAGAIVPSSSDDADFSTGIQ